jgi:hypothetical protein
MQFSEEAFKVIYKRPTDLTLINDLPVCANLLIANIFDEGESGAWSPLGRGALLPSRGLLQPPCLLSASIC